MKRLISPWAIVVLLMIAVVAAAGCSGDNEIESKDYPAFSLSSSAFEDGGQIPGNYTCTAGNISPPLAWEGAPESMEAYVLIVNDPDAPGGDFIHWIVYNIPGKTTGLPENVPADFILEPDGVQGRNGFGDTGYGGPCPPSGTHRYYFSLYALDAMLDLPAGLNVSEVRTAMADHIIAVGMLMGTYSK